jgi:hypothetical protein
MISGANLLAERYRGKQKGPKIKVKSSIAFHELPPKALRRLAAMKKADLALPLIMSFSRTIRGKKYRIIKDGLQAEYRNRLGSSNPGKRPKKMGSKSRKGGDYI